jgi:hypothetical protein
LHCYSAPNTEKTKLRVVCSGKSIESASFRAELKKELTFFRGCSGIYNLDSSNQKLEIVGEGKTKQLIRFMDWLTSLTTELVTRKVSFQGPPLVIKIEDIKWDVFGGSIHGFTATNEAPKISDTPTDAKTTEAKNMAGTDESV